VAVCKRNNVFPSLAGCALVLLGCAGLLYVWVAFIDWSSWWKILAGLVATALIVTARDSLLKWLGVRQEPPDEDEE
jgi:hypothetical protein